MGKCRVRHTRLGLAGFGGSTNSDEEPQQVSETEEEWEKKPDEDIAGRNVSSLFFSVCGSGNRAGSGSIHYELNSKTCHVVCGAHDRTDARCSTLRTLLFFSRPHTRAQSPAVAGTLYGSTPANNTQQLSDGRLSTVNANCKLLVPYQK